MSSTVLKLLKMAVGMRALLDTVMQALPQVTHCHIKPELLWPTAHFLLQRNANHFIFAVIREAHFPPEALRYSPHIEVIFAPKQFKFWIKEYSKKQVWNKKINECSFFVFFPPISFSLFRWGIWVFSSCCCFSYLQLLEWSCLETSVSLLMPMGGVGMVWEWGSHGCAWSHRV